MARRRRRRRLDEPRLLLGAFAIMWALEVIGALTDHALADFGILPRTPRGLLGIPLAPLLHGSVTHLALNSVPFLVLGGLIIISEKKRFVAVSVFVAIVGGLLVWMLGRAGAVHIGASGVIFGYFGYLLARGLTRRSFQALLLASVTVLLYGGVIVGALPGDPGVSWESHLFGLIAGVLAATVR